MWEQAKAESGNSSGEYSCSFVTSQLQKVVGVDAVGGYANTHSAHTCFCYNTIMQKYIVVDGMGKESISTVSTFKWKAHSESCMV